MSDTTPTTRDTTKIRKCSYLLPDPGGDVVRDLCDQLDEARRVAVEWNDLYWKINPLTRSPNDTIERYRR